MRRETEMEMLNVLIRTTELLKSLIRTVGKKRLAYPGIEALIIDAQYAISKAKSQQ